MGEFRMPSLGADMEEGIFLEWLVHPGDQVHRGDIIAVVETPKSAVEVECFEDGTVEELVAHEGDVIPVGGVLARLNGRREAGPTAPVAAGATAPAAPAAPAAPVVRTGPAGPPVSPVLRHRAQVLGIDLATVTGTGRHGALTRADLERAASERTAAREAETAGAPEVTAAAPTAAASGPAAVPTPEQPARQRVSPYARRLAREAGTDLTGIRGTGAGGAVRAADVRRATAVPPRRATTVPPRRAGAESMRQSIAALMTTSNREIPHYHLTATIDLHACQEWVHARNRELPVEERLVPSALMLLATARAARAVPELNGHWLDGCFRPADSVDLGLILSLRRGGLLVPVVHAADTLTVGQMMASMRELTSRARAGRLRGSDLAPPSLTVSNLGDQGVESVHGVIYPPQVALVGFGAVSERPWAVGGLLGVRPLVTATLAGDHRATDGAIGARFLKHLDRLLQRPEEL
jgi:pyruvate dehydrogenase E2 component (dihydrolipoamide acetyltransferase)